jgi:aryl-alcohol dehydrogenase-like predicted oxidoreductase
VRAARIPHPETVRSVDAHCALALDAAASSAEHARMRHAELGRSGMQIPRVVFGAWAVGGWGWGGADDEMSIRAIHASIDVGANAIDTAPVYGFGRSEEVVGRAIRGRRSEVLVFTKVGLRWDDERGDVAFETTDEKGIQRVVRRNARPWSVKHEVETSLERLGIETIDLIQVHWPDPKTPIAETMGALLALRDAGKVRAIGVSNFDVAQIGQTRAGLGDTPLASTQPKYSLVARDIERDVLPDCVREGVGVIVYSPLEQGLLSGRVPADRVFEPTDGRSRRATFRPENRARINAALESVAAPIAERHRATIGQVAIAWTLAQPGVTAAIVGARTPDQARENAAAADIALSAEEATSLRRAFEALRLDPSRPASGRGRLKSWVARWLGR